MVSAGLQAGLLVRAIKILNTCKIVFFLNDHKKQKILALAMEVFATSKAGVLSNLCRRIVCITVVSYLENFGQGGNCDFIMVDY